MNLKIWKGKKQAAKEPEGTVFLKLQYSDWDEGKVDVVAVDEEGEPVDSGYLVSLNDLGRIERHVDVNDSLGFKLNAMGQIKQQKF